LQDAGGKKKMREESVEGCRLSKMAEISNYVASEAAQRCEICCRPWRTFVAGHSFLLSIYLSGGAAGVSLEPAGMQFVLRNRTKLEKRRVAWTVA
jgi:hypothetical protein